MHTFYIYPNVKGVKTPGPSTEKTLDMPQPLVVQGENLGRALHNHIEDFFSKNDADTIDLSHLNLSFPYDFFSKKNDPMGYRRRMYSVGGIWSSTSKTINMQYCNMKNTRMINTYLVSIDFSHSDFEDAEYTDTVFNSCIFNHCNFFRANLRETVWRNCLITHSDYAFSDMRNSEWIGDLQGVSNMQIISYLCAYDGSFRVRCNWAKTKGMKVDKDAYPTLDSYNYGLMKGGIKRIKLYHENARGNRQN